MLTTASKGNPNDWEKFVTSVCFAYNIGWITTKSYLSYIQLNIKQPKKMEQ